MAQLIYIYTSNWLYSYGVFTIALSLQAALQPISTPVCYLFYWCLLSLALGVLLLSSPSKFPYSTIFSLYIFK